MSTKKIITLTLAGVAAVVIVVIGTAYLSIVSGGSVARGREPPAAEMTVAQWLLHRSVPQEFKTLKNPVSAVADSADVAAGREIYRQKCEICHANDGGGKTDIGAGQYPRPPNLHSPDVQDMSDGEVFYHIRHGIRNTGMPGWGMPDEHIWQIVAYLRNLPRGAALQSTAATSDHARSVTAAEYVGSAACKECHTSIYERWSENPHGKRRARSATTPGRDNAGSAETRSACYVYQRRHCLRVREPMEAAVFQASRRRLFSAARTVGCHA